MMRSRLSEFLPDHRGNVAMIFALSVLPVTALAGGAIEYFAARTRTKFA